jgi:hypothetical protein
VLEATLSLTVLIASPAGTFYEKVLSCITLEVFRRVQTNGQDIYRQLPKVRR